MAHQKLHVAIGADKNEQQSRNSKEVEAESVAYVICQHYGINTSDYSFGYVAGWSEGKETPELKASLNTIREAASEMITTIDEKLAVIIQEQTKDQICLEEIVFDDPQVSLSEENIMNTEKLENPEKDTLKKAKDNEKTEKKVSVKKKIQESKERTSKTSAKRTKDKKVTACV